MSNKIENSAKAANYMKLLSNKTRLLILCSIIEKPLCVNDLVKISKISQSAISQHLSLLSKENIILGKRQGNNIFYIIQDKKINKIIHTLYEIFCD